MPRHDPVPNRREPALSKVEGADQAVVTDAWLRYRKMMKWMALAAVVTVALSLLYLRQSGGPMPLHMVIATILGVGFTVLVGTALMGLIFVSSRAGHDENATYGEWNDDGRR